MDNPEFRSAVQRPAAEIDLARAALLYARDAYPDLDPALYLNQLDEWAADIQSDIAGSIDPIATLNRFLFDDLRFAGQSPLLWRSAQQLSQSGDRSAVGAAHHAIGALHRDRPASGLQVEGIGLPGHFIVRHLDRTGARYIDPFHQGPAVDQRGLPQSRRRSLEWQRWSFSRPCWNRSTRAIS